MNPGNARRGILALATLAICAVVPAPAQAQSEAAKKQEAKDHYERATRFYDVGKYGESINEYEQAYLLIEDAALLFNIGQAYRLWDRPEDAIRAYKNYLRRRPDASNRADVERKIADMEKVVEDRRRGVATPPPAPVPQAQPTQQLSPPAPSEHPSQPSPVADHGSPTPFPQAAAPLPEQQPSGAVFAQPAPAESASPPKKWIAYSLLAAGGLSLATAVVAAAVGASKAKKLQEASQNHLPFDPAVEANGKTANAIAIVTGIVGVVAGGTGGYLLWRWRAPSTPTVSIMPVAAPTFAGGSALLTF